MSSEARPVLILVVLVLVGATGFWLHRHGRPRSFLFNNNQSVSSDHADANPKSAGADEEDDVAFDFSDPEYNPACQGIIRGHFLDLASSWDQFLKSHQNIEATPEVLEQQRKHVGLPLLVWKSDLDEDESADPNSTGTHLMERPHACGTTQTQFATRLPGGRETFDLEAEERAPFPTDFAAEIVDGKLKQLWPMGVDDIPVGAQGDELLIQTHLQAICANCNKTACPRHTVIYAVQSSGEFHVVASKVSTTPKPVTCLPVEELKIMQYDSCREIKDSKSGATRLIYYQSPCT